MSSRPPIGDLEIPASAPFVLLAGPCVIESHDHAAGVAAALRDITADLDIPFVFKASYDKANRTSLDAYRGPGLAAGLEILDRIRSKVGVPIVSDVHSIEQVEAAGRTLDMLQIPAFLCRQTDLLAAAAATGKTINVKKGQFLAPWDMHNVVEKIRGSGNERIYVTERGSSFGYNRLVVDFTSLAVLRESGAGVIFDATHSVQQPGGLGGSTGGERRHVALLARAAIAAGCDGIFMEVHPDPDNAPCDGPNMVPLAEVRSLLEELVRIRQALKR